ncbi:serine/threonine-protein phosphatase 6 regulatory ankyrin repeat subunit C-like [Phymastichus coffea]|uniref:serine/threonine-protein phosphatase 6 regulatory ankyrin repeat subunit C-like n=1 Tax=Phymastichus coffea TaxID=108790 RepID=UPI00273CB623|nr:serine/threonine-protein phosphatase 6 regulatory ankyrin repeat subunit C-like [Phymastichus coffea]
MVNPEGNQALYESNGLIFFNCHLICHISRGENEEAKRILERTKRKCSIRNSLGRSLLHFSARYGNAEMTRYFVDKGIEVDARDRYGVTPLALAVQYCHVETVETLLKANADIYKTEHGPCMLQIAYNYFVDSVDPTKYLRIVKLFADIVRRDFGRIKLGMAHRLMKAGISLYLAILILKNKKIMDIYLRNGYHADSYDSHCKRTGMHAAVEVRSLVIARLLLEAGADVDALDSTGRSPLCYYKRRDRDDDNYELLQLLLNYGASLSLQPVNTAYSSPMEYLMSNGSTRGLILVLRLDVDLYHRYRQDRTPIHFLARNAYPGVVNLLEGQRFDVNARDQDGYTPLMIACDKSVNFNTVEFFLNHGAEVNAESINGETALVCAIIRAMRKRDLAQISIDICQLLLERGAKIQQVFRQYDKESKQMNYSMTVFELLVDCNHLVPISDMLISRLALKNAIGEPIALLVLWKIQSKEYMREYLNACNFQIAKMKDTWINESLSLFQLISDDENHLRVNYTNHPQFMTDVATNLPRKILREYSYYADLITTKFRKFQIDLGLFD